MKRVQQLADALRENNTVEWLDLRRNPLGPQGMEALAGALTQHPSVALLE